MAESQDLDKSEKATPFKLQEAHKKGQVAKSMEVNGLLSLLCFTAFMIAIADMLGGKFVDQLQRIFLSAGQIAINDIGVLGWLGMAGSETLLIFTPLFMMLVVVAVVTTVAQTKPVLSFHPLKPDFNRLNPAQGFKKLFSMRSLFELGKSILKMIIIGSVTYLGIDWLLLESTQLFVKNPFEIFSNLLSLFVTVALMIIVVLAPIAALDFLFVKFEFAKKMRMSKREVKDEHKRREGHPEVKSKQKEIQRELLKKSQALGDIKDSDVIVTNPTHFAVALKYEPNKMLAPIVLAKGSGPLAAKIKAQGHKYRIPIIRNPRLARLLYRRCGIDEPIPAESFKQVAPIFRWIFALKKGEK